MANTLSPAGDEPVNLESSNLSNGSASTPWTSLPLSVFNQLGSKLNVKDLHAMRLVCTNWRSNLEQHVSLKVKVDNSMEGNAKFVGRVKVESARIVNWTSDIGAEPANPLFKSPDWLKKLDLCGKMPAQWKIHNLRQFGNLAHLVLRKRALSLNNITGHQYPVLTVDPTLQISLKDALIQAYETQDPPSEDQPIELKSLQTLKILGYEYYREKPPKLVEHAYLVRNTNVCFILRHIRAPLLSCFQICNDMNSKGSMPILHTFLAEHRISLSQLFLAGLNSNFLIEHAAILSDPFPSYLRKLKLHLEGPHRNLYSREEPDQSTFVYLQKFLDAQTHLEEVSFDFVSFPVKWICDAFTSLANSCARTLRYLELYGFPNQLTGIVDLEMLSVCQNLEVFHLDAGGRTSMTFRNLEKLPTSLKRLIICEGEFNEVEIRNHNVFKRLICLEWVTLFGIRIQIASKSGNQEPERKFCRAMFKGLLGLRKLQRFYLGFIGIGLNRDPNVVKMLRSLGQRINPAQRYPHSGAEFNLNNWRYYHSRSDRPFDTKNDKE